MPTHAATPDDVPRAVRGTPPTWADDVPIAGLLAWGPFMVERANGWSSPGWGLAVEDGLLLARLEDRVLELPLLGGPFVVGDAVEALVRDGFGKSPLRVRPFRETDRAKLIFTPDDQRPLDEQAREAFRF